jgi:hypothetical protein
MTLFAGRSELLNQLDLLKSLVNVQLSVVSATADRILQTGLSQHRENLRLETFDVSLKQAEIYFPVEHGNVFRSLALQLSYKKGSGVYIRMLDLLTVAVIVCTGDMIAKSKLIFRWYNFSETGYLTELEHSVFLSRFAHCVNKLKILGSIDYTEEEVRYMAASARLKVEGKARFIEALDFDNFYLWMTSKSVLVSNFLSILRRLLNVLNGLHKRINALSDIALKQRMHQQRCITIPTISSLKNCNLSYSPILVICRSQDEITVLIEASAIESDCQELFILCEKLVPLPDEYHQISIQFKKLLIHGGKESNTAEEEMNNSVHQSHRCYKLPSYRKQLINIDQTKNCPVIRVNINQLNPDSKYLLNLYTIKTKFTPVEVITLSKSKYINPPEKKLGICILPSSVQISEVAKVLETQKVAGISSLCHAIIFTGTVCPINEILGQALTFSG